MPRSLTLITILVLVGLFAMLPSATFVVDDAFGTSRESKPPVTANQINQYANYVHFQPEWNSYPRNLIIDVTTSWEREFIPDQDEESDISKHGAKSRQNTLQYVNGKPVVAVQFDYMDCQSQWIHYAKTGLGFIGNNLESFNKEKQIPNTAYSNETQKQKLEDGFAQFIPICTSKNSTSYDYIVSVNDDSIGFDVYFVPSLVQQWNYFLFPENFEYYDDEMCYGQNLQKFTGSCKDVASAGGLLVVIPDELSRPMTKISVKLFEG